MTPCARVIDFADPALCAAPAEFGMCEPTDSAQLIGNAQRLRRTVTEEAAKSERFGRMTDRMTAAMRASGALRMAFPARRGGLEASLETQTRVVEQIATADAGIAWNAGVLAATGFYAGRLNDTAFGELYPSLELPTAGCFWPRGRADVVEGVYRVSGTWATGSGMRSASYVLGGCEVFRDGMQVMKEDGEPLVLGLWLRIEDVDILDDWQVLGLRASSSNGYAVHDAFVPASHSFDRYFSTGAYEGPLQALPELPFYSLNAIPVGIAQHAVDLAADRLLDQRDRGRPVDSRVLGLLGEAENLVRAGRAIVLEGARRIDRRIFAGETPDRADTAGGEGATATEFTQRVLRILADIVGSEFIYDRNPYEKLARDIYPVAVHGTGRPSMWVLTGEAVLDHYVSMKGSLQ